MYLKTMVIIWLVVILLLTTMNSYAYKLGNIKVNLYSSINELYDDNITFVKENKIEDFITNLTLGLSTKYKGKIRGFELKGDITKQFYSENYNFNNTFENLTLNFQNEFSQYDRLSLKNVFVHSKEPRSFENAFGRTTGRYNYYSNKLDLDYIRDFAQQFSVKVKYANERDEFLELSNSYLNRVGCEGEYILNSKTIILLSYVFANRNFDPGTNASINTTAIDLKQYISKQLYFEGEIGIDFINSYDDRKYQKPIISASLIDKVDHNTTASLSFTKKYYANPYIEDIFNHWKTSGIYEKRLLKRLRSSLSAFYGRGEYVSSNIKDKLLGGDIAFTYGLRDNLEGNLAYTYSRTDSTIESQEYTKNIVFFQLTAEF